MISIQKTFHITLGLSASDWQLYTTMPGAEDVAKDLNESIAKAINENQLDLREAQKACYRILERHSNFGAYDTEPVQVLDEILQKAFDQKSEDVRRPQFRA